ncbi:MAG: GNAT family N-acetyltransferase [Bacteroidetes bacterium]|nr:GNAT family N-acetyltransferase [Bacteroidota bacterium]MBP6427560.1 GNAT family N-acetyltransferase [Bacteroidia bacterium]
MNVIIETDRLFLRQFIADDAIELFNLNNDPDVVKYTGDKPFRDLREAQQFVNDYSYSSIPSNPNTPIGRWAVIRKSDNTFIGWCGLKFVEKLNEIDLGFRLHKIFWGQGFATEAGIGCLDFGFHKLKVKEIAGRSMKENLASIRVLEKCGMKYRNDFVFAEHPGACFVIIRNE